jgi:hypothetical protein
VVAPLGVSEEVPCRQESPQSRVIHPHRVFLVGASLAITAGAMVAYWVTGQLGRAAEPSGQGTVQTVIDWLVVALFSFLMVRAFLRRKDTKRPKWMGGCSMACPASSTLRARSVAETAAPRAVERLRRVVRLARLTHQQRACGAGCRTPASSHAGTWPYFGTVSAATLMPNGAWTPGVVMRVRASALIGRAWAYLCPRWACCPRPPAKQPPLQMANDGAETSP